MADHCKIYFISPDGHVIIKEEAKKSGLSDVLNQANKKNQNFTAVPFQKVQKIFSRFLRSFLKFYIFYFCILELFGFTVGVLHKTKNNICYRTTVSSQYFILFKKIREKWLRG
jgi:hypothetical protein